MYLVRLTITTAIVLLWIQSYLCSPSFSVKTSKTSSHSLHLWCKVQGAVLGPFLFILYTTSVSSLIKVFSVDHHNWRHSTIHSFLSKHFVRPIDHYLLRVVAQISSWMTSSIVFLNLSNQYLHASVSNSRKFQTHLFLQQWPIPSTLTYSFNIDRAPINTFTH